MPGRTGAQGARLRIRALITAGGTTEPIDDVRGVTNVSTGRFGAALARALHARGVEVTVIGSAMALTEPLPPDVRRVPFRTAADLAARLHAEPAPHLLLMAAAVSDYAPVAAAGKLRSDADALDVHLERVPKILPGLRARFPDATIVGFKLLSGVPPEALHAAARRQRTEAHVDLVVANDLAELRDGQHPVWLVGDGVQRIEGAREAVAEALASALLAGRVHGVGPWAAVPGPVRGRLRRWIRIPVAWTAPSVPARTPESLLAGLTALPWRPMAVREGRGVRLGLGEHDLDRLAEGWTRATAALADLDTACVPLVDDGVVVAAAAVVGDHTALASTGLADDDVWPQRVLPSLPSRPWLVPEPEIHAWTDRGFAVVGRRVGRVVCQAPWDREDPLPAASACLVDRIGARVLVGARLRAPALGAVAFPGGKVEAAEGPLDAVRRELVEETGLSAPLEAPAFVVRTWRGRTPTWAVTTGVWAVPEALETTATEEMHATWRALEAVLADPTTLPGVRAVLTELRSRMETGWVPS